MRCSRRNTSNVPTQCYALARRKSTPRHHTTPHIYVVLTYRTQPWPSMRESRTFAPFSEKLSGVGHEIHRPIRNTLILGLGGTRSQLHVMRFDWLPEKGACQKFPKGGRP